jgi:general secretion pathway protein N
MQRSRSLIAVALAAIIVMLIAAASVLPARWVLRLMPKDSILTVADADGTIWNGQAWIALGYPETRRMLADPVKWQWNGFSIELRHPWLRGPVTLSPGLGSMQISAQQAQLPAATLISLGAPWNTLVPSGNLELSWHTLSTRQPQGAGPLADLVWRNAGSAMSMVSPLGDYRLRLASTGKDITADLSTDKGALDLTGHGAWDGKRWNFQGLAKASTSASDAQTAQLSGLLNTIGPKQGNAHKFGTQ